MTNQIRRLTIERIKVTGQIGYQMNGASQLVAVESNEPACVCGQVRWFIGNQVAAFPADQHQRVWRTLQESG